MAIDFSKEIVTTEQIKQRTKYLYLKKDMKGLKKFLKYKWKKVEK